MFSLMRGIPINPTPSGTESASAAEARQNAMDKRAALAATQNLRLEALSIVASLAEDLAGNALGNDSPAGRLDALMAQSVAPDEFDEDEDVENDDIQLQVLSAHIADALASLGVPANLVTDVFSENQAEANRALRLAADTLTRNLPPAGSAQFGDFASKFVFGFSEPDMSDLSAIEAGFDAMTVGKTSHRKSGGRTLFFHAVTAIRNGIKTVVNKRVSGSVILSPAQREALHKARAKAHSGAAVAKRKRSMQKRKNLKPYHPAHYIPTSTDSAAKKRRMHVQGAKAKAEYEVGLRKAHKDFRG